jgi:hypothetical protein
LSSCENGFVGLVAGMPLKFCEQKLGRITNAASNSATDAQPARQIFAILAAEST